MRADVPKLEGYAEALALIRHAICEHGILASTTDVDNYKRIWARDGIISGLAVLPTQDEYLITGLRSTLLTLASAQKPNGHIPNNVQFDAQGNVLDFGFGTICGRIDSSIWFIIGVCNYVHFTNDFGFASEMERSIERALDLLTTWEFNYRGLIYVPQSGDWADEYIFHGYVLLEQLLRLWALKCHARIFNSDESSSRASNLQELIRMNYWPKRAHQESEFVYHVRAYRFFLDEHGEPTFFLAALTPGGYCDQFDAFANALSILLDLPDSRQCASIIDFGESIVEPTALNMLACIWPPIQEGDHGWPELQNNYKYEFKNYPYKYHNGGLWPMINGWWGLALQKAHSADKAREILHGIYEFNRRGLEGEWGFYEYADALTGEPHGTSHMTWSAAGAVMLQHGIEGKGLFFG